MRVTIPMLTVLALLTVLAGVAAGQPARLGNGTVTARALSGPLDRALDQSRAGVGRRALARPTRFATAPGDRWMCDWNEWTRQQPPATSARLEPADSAYVFYRMEAGRIDRVRLFSPGCAIDAAGRPVEWLTGVSASRQRPHADRAGPNRRAPPGRRGDGRLGCCMPAPRP